MVHNLLTSKSILKKRKETAKQTTMDIFLKK
jgi:hypothetical protein